LGLLSKHERLTRARLNRRIESHAIFKFKPFKPDPRKQELIAGNDNGSVIPSQIPTTTTTTTHQISKQTKSIVLQSVPKNLSMSLPVYRLQVVANDGGIVFDVGSHQTLKTVMNIACSKWINIVRNGDGGVDDHHWEIKKRQEKAPTPPGRKTPKYDPVWAVYHQAYTAHVEADSPLSPRTQLGTIRWLKPGQSFQVTYDFGWPSNFEIKLLTTKKFAGQSLPARVPSAADRNARSLVPYQLPLKSPNLNDIFPHANDVMFQSGNTRWICPYPCSQSCGGYVGGEFQRHYNVVFLPAKCSNLNEALSAIDRAMKKYPEDEGEQHADFAKCRLAFPVNLTAAK
jgi:hypothetical protein